jgi:hypothetical protein
MSLQRLIGIATTVLVLAMTSMASAEVIPHNKRE